MVLSCLVWKLWRCQTFSIWLLMRTLIISLWNALSLYIHYLCINSSICLGRTICPWFWISQAMVVVELISPKQASHLHKPITYKTYKWQQRWDIPTLMALMIKPNLLGYFKIRIICMNMQIHFVHKNIELTSEVKPYSIDTIIEFLANSKMLLFKVKSTFIETLNFIGLDDHFSSDILSYKFFKILQVQPVLALPLLNFYWEYHAIQIKLFHLWLSK